MIRLGRLLRDASIRTKVLVLVMFVTTVALLLASASLLAWDYRQFKADIGRELSTQAEMVLLNSTTAMEFDDEAVAHEVLGTLASNEHIRMACLYTAGRALYTQVMLGNGSTPCPAPPPDGGVRFAGDRVQVAAWSSVNGRPRGSIYLESDLRAVAGRIRVQALTAALVLGVSLVVALLLSSVLQRIISEPIDALLDTSRQISTRSDYSLRAHKTTGDELGVLVDAFNAMLAHIEGAEQERVGLLAREREANRLKDEFLMTLSHELRTPLNAIQGWTRMLISKVIPADGIDKALHKIERNAQAQAKLVEDLLQISRFTTGKFRLDRIPVDLVTIANQAIETIRPDAEARGITIERQFELAAAPLSGDPDRLQQVIWNLLSNAVKFSSPGSAIVVSLHHAGANCALAVQDHGVGIDAAFLPFVFEPFRQADASSTRAHGGLGLGLSIVRRIVDLHGGLIEAKSAGVGQGATMTVTLPLAAVEERPAPPPAAEEHWFVPGELGGIRMLVVDDDSDTREMVATLLTTAGARVIHAGGAAEALHLAAGMPPDVLLSDIAMPGGDGYTLLNELRSRFGRSVPRVAIALTARVSRADRERALAAGFDRHVAKPFDPMALIELLREVIAASPR